MSPEKESNGEDELNELKPREKAFMNKLGEKVMALMNMDALDKETIRDVERVIIVRVSTKHINLWTRQLEMKRKEIGELLG